MSAPASAPPPRAIAWAQRAAGGRVERVEPLAGATSAAVHALLVRTPAGSERELVLRRFVREWIAEEPDAPEREARVLEAVAPLPFPTPELVAADPRAEHCDAPALLMTRVPGAPVLVPDDEDAWLRALVAPLPALHALGASAMPELQYRPWYDVPAARPPAWSSRPELWERMLEAIAGSWPELPEVAIHRDYHPANVLFAGGRLPGVVDWTNACRGPAANDVAHCRLNLALLRGPDCADAFLQRWREETGWDHPPLFDLLDTGECLPHGGPRWYEGFRALGVPRVPDAELRARLEEHVARTLARLR